MSKYSISYEEKLDANALEEAINDIDKRLTELEKKDQLARIRDVDLLGKITALESKQGGQGEGEPFDAEIGTLAYDNGYSAGYAAGHNEATRRLAASAPTPRQQVAEAFLKVFADIFITGNIELAYAAIADYLRRLAAQADAAPEGKQFCITYPLRQAAAALESADQPAPLNLELERNSWTPEKMRWMSGAEAQIINPIDDDRKENPLEDAMRCGHG